MSENTLNVPVPTTDESSDDNHIVINVNTVPNTTNTTTNTDIINKVDNQELVSKLHLDKYLSFIDDNDTKQIVLSLINDSNAVKSITNILDLILADGKIDIADAPLLVGLIKKIIALRTKDIILSQNLTLNHFLDIIRLVFTILSKEGVLKVTNADEFIQDINKLIKFIKMGENIAEVIPCCSMWFSNKI
jgi:hypothetical protein